MKIKGKANSPHILTPSNIHISKTKNDVQELDYQMVKAIEIRILAGDIAVCRAAFYKSDINIKSVKDIIIEETKHTVTVAFPLKSINVETYSAVFNKEAGRIHYRLS